MTCKNCKEFGFINIVLVIFLHSFFKELSTDIRRNFEIKLRNMTLSNYIYEKLNSHKILLVLLLLLD